MRRFILMVVACFCVLAQGVDFAVAAKKRSSAPVPAKAIHEAPMRVFIVRNSQPGCEPTCPEWIGAEGEITTATPGLFRKVFKQMGKKKLPVVIRSPGGSIEAALEIGRMIRKAGLTVAVGYTQFSSCSPAHKTCVLAKEKKGIFEGTVSDYNAFCNSACPMILAGGMTRLAGSSSWIGLHEPRTTWTREWVKYRETYKIIRGKKKVTSRKVVSRKTVRDKTTFGLHKSLRKSLTTHYKAMGVDLAILDDTVKAKFKDLYFLPEARKASLKLVTSTQSAVLLSSPMLCGEITTCTTDLKRIEKRETLQVSSDGVMMPILAMPEKALCKSSCPFWIYGEGKITDATVSTFRSLMVELGAKKAPIILQSSEGDLKAGMELGRLFRMYNRDIAVAKVELSNSQTAKQFEDRIGTHVVHPSVIKPVGTCNSSCTLALMGGVKRISYSEWPLWVSDLTTYKKAKITDAMLTQYFEEMGVKPELFQAIQRLKPQQSSAKIGKSQTLLGLINSGMLPSWLSRAAVCQEGSFSQNCLTF